MGSITTHGMCELLIAKLWVRYGQATSIIINGGEQESTGSVKVYLKIKSQHLVLSYVNINKGQADRPIHNSTLIWNLQLSAQWSISQDAPLMRCGWESVHFCTESQKQKRVQQHHKEHKNHSRKWKAFNHIECSHLSKYLGLFLATSWM
jgi:hypothetical protein